MLAARLACWRWSIWLEPELSRFRRLAAWHLLRARLRTSAVVQARRFQVAIHVGPIVAAVAATMVWAVLLASSNVALRTMLNPNDLATEASADVRMSIECAAVAQPNDLAIIADCVTNPPG